MKHFRDILLLCFLSLSLMAQNVTVTGRVNRPEALLRLMVFDDLLNMHETMLSETYADDKGFFILEGNVGQIMPASIYVGLESVDFVVSPGATYDVSITVPDADPSLSYFERPLPTLRVKTATDKGVYRQIVISEMIIDDYVLNYFDQLYRRRQYRYLDSIQAAIDAELHITDDYVLQCNTYKIAAVQMAVNADGGKKVIQEFYDGKPVLYHCQSYVDLFKDLFKNYEMSEEFRKRNPELAEMVNLYQLRGLYYGDFKSRKWVKNQLDAIGRSKTPETKTMVANMLDRFNRFAQGSDAPDFGLQSWDGTTVRLSDYKDSMVLLQFVEKSSQTVDYQFEVLSDLHHQWQDSVQIITITTKDQLSSCRKRFEEHHYDWPLLNLGNDILLLERYEVRTFPEYFIILPGTKIGMAPAPALDGGMEKAVRKLYGK